MSPPAISRAQRSQLTMRRQFVLPACWLLLWTLTGSKVNGRISIKSTSSAITLTCEDNNAYITDNGGLVKSLELTYRDDKSGEYSCTTNTTDSQSESIYVKFRTCDNCIDLEKASIAGMAIGDVVATVVVGVAVYLVASQRRPVTSEKKSSTTRPLISNEVRNNDPYQRLRFNKGDQKAMYDVINNKR